jgi:hypothetical protein
MANKSIRFRSAAWFLAVAFLCLAGCAPSSSDLPDDWRYDDVRLFDPIDAPQADLDITVISTRVRGGRFELRLELLDVPELPTTDIWLFLAPHGARPSGNNGDLDQLPVGDSGSGRGCRVKFAAGGSHQIWDALGRRVARAQLKIVRDPVLDLLDLSFRLPCGGTSGSNLALTIWLAPQDKLAVADSAGPVNLTALPPGKARVLLAFWNTFPAVSPATALRAWDGAHKGYFGERHGLSRLLDAAKGHTIPIVLLDLKTPESLSALDYVGGLERVQSLARSGHLILPEASLPSLDGTVSRAVFERMLSDSRQAGITFGLRPSQIAYFASPRDLSSLPNAYRLVLTHGPSAEPPAAGILGIQRSAATLQLLLPEPSADQAIRQGLSLVTRRQLVGVANRPGGEGANIVLLGGNLATSAWGDERAARAALEYLSVRPWIDWLAASDLFALRDGEPIHGASSGRITSQAHYPIDVYSDHPAWFTFRANQLALGYPWQVAAPLHDTNRWLHTSIYEVSSQVGMPTQPQSCTQIDSTPDRTICVLASKTVTAAIDPHGAGLFFLAVGHPAEKPEVNNGYTQIIGSSAQLALGLSDPSTWNLQAGVFADPASIPGAFATAVEPEGFQLTQDSLDVFGDVDLHYSLLKDGIRIEGQIPAGSSYQSSIPIIFEPERRFDPGWAQTFSLQPFPDGYSLDWMDTGRVTVTSSADLEIHSYHDSFTLASNPEDPDYDYPPGHFLPFPLARVTLHAFSNFFVEIRFTDAAGAQAP